MIYQGRFRYGQIYSLNELSSELHISRTPVRDAVQRLCDERRLDLLPSRGFRLYRITEEDMLQHYHFSCAIEGYCVQCLAKIYRDGGHHDSVDRMKTLVSRMQELCRDEEQQKDISFQEYFYVDSQFHFEIIQSLGNALFVRLSNAQIGFYDHPELQLTELPIQKMAVLHCHEHILDAIIAGNPTEAYEAQIAHADLMYQTYLNLGSKGSKQ